MQKNSILKLTALALASGMLVSCGGGTSSSSTIQPSSTAPDTSSQAPAPSSSSEAPAPSSSSEVPSSSSGSEAPIASNITKAVDFAAITNDTVNHSDGFFTATGCTPSATNLKTGGTSTLTNHVVSFTIVGQGTISITAGTGAGSGAEYASSTRNFYVAKDIGDGAFKVIAMAKTTIKDGTKTPGTIECNLSEIGTYYIMSASSVTITDLSVTYDENNVTILEATPFSASLADPNVLFPVDLYPCTIADGTAYGNWTIGGTANNFGLKGDRTINGSKTYNVVLNLGADGTLKATTTGAASVVLYANIASSEAATATLTMKNASDVVIASTANTITSLDGNKTLTADSGSIATFNVTEAGTYTISTDMAIEVFLAEIAVI